MKDNAVLVDWLEQGGKQGQRFEIISFQCFVLVALTKISTVI